MGPPNMFACMYFQTDEDRICSIHSKRNVHKIGNKWIFVSSLNTLILNLNLTVSGYQKKP